MVFVLCCLIAAWSQTRPVLAQSKKVMELVKDLKSRPKVRINAAEELGRLADVRLNDAKTALPALKAAMKDPDAGVRQGESSKPSERSMRNRKPMCRSSSTL